MRHQIAPLLSPFVTTVMNRKQENRRALTGGSGRWSGLHFCRLLSLLLEAAAREHCAAETDRPPAGVTEQGILLSTDGSATVPALFCALAGERDVPAECSVCVTRPGRGMCLLGRRRGPGGCLN